MDCTDCHGFAANRFGLSTTTLPTHEVCAVCHTIDETSTSQESCSLCHTQSDFAVGVFARRLNEELRFEHDPHVQASVDCRECH
ncbi:MAG: hypothetical protein IID40_08255, partial [Planctomycetes bacterium]|nr:hypothetical protein [Planctomycetota bacterium]